MKTSILVQNLKCAGCAKTITAKLSELENISDLDVDLDTASVSFLSENLNDTLEVKNTLKTLGYPSIDTKNSVTAKAMSFFSCVTGKISR